jgi:hypothetical protein
MLQPYIIIALLAAAILSGCESTYVDGVRTYGRLRAVSVADIRSAIIASKNARIGGPAEPYEVEVIGRDEIHVYRGPRIQDRGWNIVRRINGKWMDTGFASLL